MRKYIPAVLLVLVFLPLLAQPVDACAKCDIISHPNVIVGGVGDFVEFNVSVVNEHAASIPLTVKVYWDGVRVSNNVNVTPSTITVLPGETVNYTITMELEVSTISFCLIAVKKNYRILDFAKFPIIVPEDIAPWADDIARLEEMINTLSNELVLTQQQFTELFSILSNDLEMTQQEIVLLASGLAELELRVDELEEMILALNNELDMTRQELLSLIEELSERLDLAEEEILRLEGMIDELTGETHQNIFSIGNIALGIAILAIAVGTMATVLIAYYISKIKRPAQAVSSNGDSVDDVPDLSVGIESIPRPDDKKKPTWNGP